MSVTDHLWYSAPGPWFQ